MNAALILIVDDEPSVRTSLAEALTDEHYRVELAGSAEEALEKIERCLPDLVLIDIWLPGMDGIGLLREISCHHAGLPSVMISGHGNIETAVESTKLGAFDYLEKPLSLDRLLLVVRNALQQSMMVREISRLRAGQARRFRIVGSSPAIRTLRDTVSRAGPSNGRVLITGESGTGKELVAKSIHLESRRASQAFVELNCAAIPEELIENELFGHEKGAFTDAVHRKRGKFELADSGTLFLDEIGDMSSRTQAKVLRVLEEQRVERLGGSESIAIDVRVIAATNSDLPGLIREGLFREDLFYRLNVIPIEIPPLRARLEDLPELTEHFLRMIAEETGDTQLTVSPSAMKKLTAHAWPGNVRELRNVLERATIMSAGDVITADDIILTDIPLSTAWRNGSVAMPTLREARLNFERDFIRHALEENGWNVTRTAEALNLERSHLHRKMKLFGLHATDGP